MRTFRYKALAKDGELRKGLLDASSAHHARQLLRDTQLAPLEVVATTLVIEKVTGIFAKKRRLGISRKQVALSTLQLSTMLGAGVPLSQALTFIAKRSPKNTSELFHSIRNDITQGETLALAMAAYPDVFDTLYIASVEAGEQAGVLDKVLKHLAEFQEISIVNRQKISSALIYPAILLVASLSVVTLLLIGVMPGFIEIFDQNGQALPPITIFVLGTVEFLTSNGIWLVLFLVINIGIFRRALGSSKILWKIDHALLSIPRINTFIVNRTAENLSRTLHILSNSGMQLVDALKIATKVITNRVLYEQLTECTHLVEQGNSFSDALSVATSMPAIFIQLVESGEASGELDATLKKSVDILQRETQSTLTTVIALIEPVILILVSCLVFIIVIALMQPIFQLNTFI